MNVGRRKVEEQEEEDEDEEEEEEEDYFGLFPQSWSTALRRPAKQSTACAIYPTILYNSTPKVKQTAHNNIPAILGLLPGVSRFTPNLHGPRAPVLFEHSSRV